MRFFLAVMVAGLAVSSSAAAEDLLAPDFIGRNWGMTGNITTSPKCLAVVTIDQPTFSAHVPDMVQSHIFSDRVGPEMANSSPHYMMNILETETAPLIVEETFSKYQEIQSCHFEYKYINPDVYGNDKEYNMISFDMARETVNKINWERFNVNNLMKVSRNFHADPNYSKLVNDESLVAIMMLRGG